MSELVVDAKNSCYEKLANELTDPLNSSKTYWSILKTFCNNEKTLDATIIHSQNLESDFKLKAVHFNKYFASRCTSIENDSSLPSTLEFYSQSRISSLNVIEDDILKIIRALDINKAHGHYKISVRMIKACDKALVKRLFLI